MLTLTEAKKAIAEAGRADVEKLVDQYGEDVVKAALDIGIQLEDVEEAYAGQFSSDRDFAMDMADQLGELKKGATWPHNCIDWDYAAKELMYDYSESGGHYFRNL